MHFTTPLTLLALALPTLSSPVPPTHAGQWSVTIKRSNRTQVVHAVYYDESYPSPDGGKTGGIQIECAQTYPFRGQPAPTSRCNDPRLNYSYDGKTISLQQNIDMPQKETVFGSAPLVLADAGDDLMEGEATVQVMMAIPDKPPQ